jgi:hypothetical protein
MDLKRNQGAPQPREARYEARGLLGVGAMGEVHLCRDGWIGRDVAVKTAPRDAAARETRERFLREARIQGQLEHPSIVPVYDMGIDADGDEFFAMKRVSGRTLTDVIEDLAVGDSPALSSEFSRVRLLGIFRQVCLAIEYAHSRGVVHRDLKPANLMVGQFGEVYVLDWGLARVRGVAGESFGPIDAVPGGTLAGQTLGTPGYMAPEQIASADSADERADVYALGAILFEILTLTPLNPGLTHDARLRATQLARREPPSARVPDLDIPPELDAICLGATAHDPEARTASARELAEAVERFLEGDRDLEARREGARNHADAAERAAAVARGAGPGANEARAAALREAARAFVLDPEGRQGMRTALELMLVPPTSLPPEVESEIRQTAAASERTGTLAATGTYLAMLFFLAALPLWLPVRNPLGLSVILAPLAVAFAFGILALRSTTRGLRQWATLAHATFAFAAIGGASGFCGSMIIVPPIAVALSLACVANLPDFRILGQLLGVASYALPFVLAWAGFVPESYTFGAGEIRIRAILVGFPETPARLTLLAAVVSVHLVAGYAVWRVARDQETLRQKWLLQNWHLRQMTAVDG